MDNETGAIRLTVDDVGLDQDHNSLATLVSDTGQQVTIPLALLPEGTRVGDVLSVGFTLDPEERELRRKKIADLQRRLFGSG
jgi:hypothetical protein